MFKRLLFAATTTLLITSCGEASTLDVGDPKAQIGSALTDYAAQWDGYGQAFTFPGDQTDRVRVELDEEGNGTIRFGNEELFPAATDPEAWYPPTYLRNSGSVSIIGNNLNGVRSGFEFRIQGASVEDARLKFEFDPNVLMDSWCALQENDPYEGWTCGEGGFGGSGDDPQVCQYQVGETDVHHEINCIRAAQCFSCKCDESGCHGNGSMPAHFDAVLSDEGATLTGTLVMPSLSNARVTVVMSQ